MQIKNCCRCKDNPPTSAFGIRKLAKNGLRSICKKCRKLDRYNAVELGELPSAQYKEKRNKRQKIYYIKNKKARLAYRKNYYNKNYIKKRAERDVSLIAMENLPDAIFNNLTGKHISTAQQKSINFLSYTMQELKEHLEAQFSEWMNFNNIRTGKRKSRYHANSERLDLSWKIAHINTLVSAEEHEIKKYWALENIVPKQISKIKTFLSKEQLGKILELYNENIGSRQIAKVIGVNRSTIQRAYQQLGLDSFNKRMPGYIYKSTERKCKLCQTIKPIDMFRKRVRGDRIGFEGDCSDCKKNIDNERLKRRAKKLRENNPCYVIKSSISHSIWVRLKSKKNNKSCLNYLSYSISDLKLHLEKQFEPWMNWINYGRYKADDWNDNDQSTWKWQIDHIIPQSDLPYLSMEDDNFKKCWALENLRPYSAKQNLVDGVRRTRHIKNNIYNGNIS